MFASCLELTFLMAPIIGMGSVISRNVPPLSIVGSQPFRILKPRDKEHYEKLENLSKYGGVGGVPFRSEAIKVKKNSNSHPREQVNRTKKD